MIAKMWIAIAAGMCFLMGGISVVAAAGAMNGDCDQIKDQLQLKDGTGDNCTNTTLSADEDAEPATNNWCWNWVYGTTDEEAPHQSSCADLQDGDEVVLGDCESCNDYYYNYLYGTPGPHQSQSGVTEV